MRRIILGALASGIMFGILVPPTHAGYHSCVDTVDMVSAAGAYEEYRKNVCKFYNEICETDSPMCGDFRPLCVAATKRAKELKYIADTMEKSCIWN